MKIILNILFILSSTILFAQTEGWNRLNGPTKGEIIGIEITKDQTIYAITTSENLYYRKSNSSHWQASTIPIPEYSPYRFEYHADFNGYQFINYSSGNSYTAPSFGIYRSIDNGLTWQQVVKKMDIPRLIQSRKGILYALREWNNINTTLFSSTNNGDTWDSISSFPFKAVDMTINDEEKIYITINDYQRTVLIYNTLSGFYNTAIYNTLTSSASPNATTIIMYKGIPFIKSSDTCFYVDKDNNLVKRGQIGVSPYTFPRPIISSPNGILFTLSSTTLYSQSIKILYSRDTGLHWDSFPSFPPARAGSESPYNIHLAVDLNDILYCGTPSGIFSSNDLGKSWKSLGLPICNIPLLQKGPENSLFIHDSSKIFYSASYYQYGITQVLLSTDKGLTWGKSYFTPGGAYGRFAYDDIGGIYYFDYEGEKSLRPRLWYSTTSAPYSFELHNISMPIPSATISDGDKLFAIIPWEGLFVTTDKGVSWDGVNIPQTGTYLLSFGIDSKGTYYTGFSPSLYKSNDEGRSWNKLSTGIMNTGISVIKFAAPNTIIIGTYSNGVWHSTDDGSTWERWDLGIRDSVNTIEIIGNRCYVATRGGLLSCSLGSNDWKNELLIDEEVNIHQILSLDNQHVYVATEDYGIWSNDGKLASVLPQRGASRIEILAYIGIHESYLRLLIDEPQFVTIELYDMLGGKRMDITNTWFSNTESKVLFNSDVLPSGTYIVCARTKTGVASGKITITH